MVKRGTYYASYVPIRINTFVRMFAKALCYIFCTNLRTRDGVGLSLADSHFRLITLTTLPISPAQTNKNPSSIHPFNKLLRFILFA
jgi:hypothetical protein